MNQIEIFEKEEFGSIRTVQTDGEPWFVASDICKALGLSNPTMVVQRLDEDERAKFNLGVHDNVGMNCVNEYGLYSLILASRKKEAKEFKRWITHEVLPSIRKHGMYAQKELLDNLDLLISVAQELKDEREKSEKLFAANERMKPKEEFFDAVADSKDAIEIGKVAKVLNRPGIGRNKLFEILRRNGILMKDNTPYQKYIDNGCFRTIEQKYCMPDGETRISIKTLVYQKGVDYIRKILEVA